MNLLIYNTKPPQGFNVASVELRAVGTLHTLCRQILRFQASRCTTKPRWGFKHHQRGTSCCVSYDLVSRIVGFQASIATLSLIEVSSIASVESRGVERER